MINYQLELIIYICLDWIELNWLNSIKIDENVSWFLLCL